MLACLSNCEFFVHIQTLGILMEKFRNLTLFLARCFMPPVNLKRNTMNEKQRKKKAIIAFRSRIPFPPTKVFKDRRKEASKKACRGRLNEPSFFVPA